MNDNRGTVSFSESTRQKMSEATAGEKNPMYGLTGEKSPTFKGFTIGTYLENGKTIIFDGERSMKARGFSPGNISYVISGKRPHHKNFTFIRTKDPDVLQSLLDQDNFVDEESKNIILNFLQNV